MKWSFQSQTTHILSEGFTQWIGNSPHAPGFFNLVRDSLHDQLSQSNPIKFPRFGRLTVAAVDILAALCHDNEIGRRMVCISCAAVAGNIYGGIQNGFYLMPNFLSNTLRTQFSSIVGLSPHAPFATVEDWCKVYMASYICPNHGVSHYAGFL
jgi:hypothetical protein